MPNGQCFYKLYTNKWKNEKSYVKKSVQMLLVFVELLQLFTFQDPISSNYKILPEIARNHKKLQDYTRNYKIIQEITININKLNDLTIFVSHSLQRLVFNIEPNEQ